MNVNPGLRERLYIAGVQLQFGPLWAPESTPIEVDQEMADCSTLTELPLEPYPHAADWIEKVSGKLSWDAVHTPADIQVLEDMKANPRSFDFCDWRPITELFSGDGTNVDITLHHRIALLSIASGLLPVNPTYAAATYGTEIWVDDVEDTAYTVGTADALGRLPITLSLTPSDAEANVIVRYVPLYLVRRKGADRAYPGGANNYETRVLHLKGVA